MRAMILCCGLALAVCSGCYDDSASVGHAGKADGGATGDRDAGDAGDRDAASGSPNIHRLDGGEHAAGMDEGLVSGFMQDAGDGWKSLIQAHWVLPAGTEQYRCARVTAPEDAVLHSFRALSPVGTHHTVLTIATNPTEPDGLTVCDVTTNAQAMLSASGVGTNDYTLPDGVGIRVHKGEQLLLNLHLFNVSAQPIEGTSGSLVKVLAESEVTQEAESILAGPVALQIPAHSTNVVQSGACTMSEDVTLTAVGAHAHMHATHVTIVAHSSIDGDVVLSDRDYAFDAQRIYALDPLVKMKAGDKVEVACTYDNAGDSPLTFGDSSLAEMCFAGLFRYPAVKNPQLPCVR